jgi:hypothetical protein
MEHSRYDWARQELEAVKFELYRLNHLKNYTPSMQFFSNELRAIEEIQAELLNRAPLTPEVQEKIYWLAAQLEWTRQCTAYKDKVLVPAAQVAAVSSIMGGHRSQWMAPAPSWTVYGD